MVRNGVQNNYSSKVKLNVNQWFLLNVLMSLQEVTGKTIRLFTSSKWKLLNFCQWKKRWTSEWLGVPFMEKNLNFRKDPSQQPFQRCFNFVFRLIWRRDIAQHQINVAFVNVGNYKVEQRWVNVVYFNVDLNNARQC